MILVDTSVIIDAIRGAENDKVGLLRKIIALDMDFGISGFTYTETLQGARNEHNYAVLQEYLSALTIYYPPGTPVFYSDAARVFFDLRRRGKTVRSTIDLLIAQTAVYYDLYLLHNDKDFDIIAEIMRVKVLDSIEGLLHEG